MEGLIPLEDADCYLVEGFIEPTAARKMLEVLHDSVAWSQPRINLFGKQVASPRLAAWYGDPGTVYTYSGLENRPLPWLPELDELREKLQAFTGAVYNSVLANLYRSGADAMGWHADAEKELGENPVIASVSLGATRRFLLRHKRRRDIATVALELNHGSLLLMRGQTQHHWRHSVPRTRRPTAPRINLTYRQVLSPPASS